MNRIYKDIHVIISAVILVLECLPNGIRLFFFAGPDNSYVMTTSYFDMVTLGNGDFFPLIAAIVTIVLLVCSIIHIFVKKQVLVRCMMSLYIAAAVCSVLHILLNGFRAVTVVNGAVVILFAVGIWLLVMENESEYKKETGNLFKQ